MNRFGIPLWAQLEMHTLVVSPFSRAGLREDTNMDNGGRARKRRTVAALIPQRCSLRVEFETMPPRMLSQHFLLPKI